MSFVWTNNPNYPTVTPPEVLGPTEVSTEVHVVANTVNVSPILGVLSYNTRNVGYDVVYALPSLNVNDLHISHLNADNIQVHGVATINTANIGAATINTANIVNATIANGTMGVNPAQNTQIATKEYVDSVMANSTPLGGNLQLLIQAAGDLLVGVSDNTAERLPIGTTDRQVLAAGGSGNTGVHWVGPQGSVSTHRGMVIGTHWDGALRNSQIQLIQTDEIVMDDGERITSGWNGLIADTSVSGAGGIDTGTVLPNTCYEIYAIRNSVTGDQALLLHRAKDCNPDVHLPTTAATPRNMNYSYGINFSETKNIAQRFVAHKTGPFKGIDLSISQTGNCIGNVWVTLESDNGNGNTSGTVLATSRKYEANRIGNLDSDVVRMRFPFDVSANVSNGTIYWANVQYDYARADNFANPNYLRMWGDITTSYPEGAAKFFNANTGGWALSNSGLTIDQTSGPSNLYFRTFIEANSTPVTMPTGYDQRCLVSYCSTNIRTTLREYHQRDYKMSMAWHYTWCYFMNGGLQSQRADNPGANNTTQVAFPCVIHMGEMVPPVPCLVWIYKYTALGGAAMFTVGDLSGTDFKVQIFQESRGALNATIFASENKIMGPFLVEYGAHMDHSGGAVNGQLAIAAIEF